MDVLDNVHGETIEIYLHNLRLTDGLALHRFRQMGFHIHVLDVLDEPALTKVELLNLFYSLFATTTPLPHPEQGWNGFCQGVANLVQNEKPTWNSITKTMVPWINITMLHTFYSRQEQQQCPQYHRVSSWGSPTKPP